MSATDAAVPAHVGLILDGNRRWAKAQGLPKLEGHRQGYANLKTIGKYAISKGVKFVSAYIFSTENWNRAKEEVDYLMNLALWVATNEVKELHKEGIRVLHLGSKERVEPKIIKAIEKAEKLTANNTNGTLGLCFNYGGQTELVDAFKAMNKEGISSNDITVESVTAHLYAPEIPACDLIIRTSGERRLSNFMLWRAAYSELLFVDKTWPDFSEADFDDALNFFAERKRNFGQ